MEVALIFILIVLAVVLVFGAAIGVSRRARKRTEQITKQYGGGPTATDIPPLPTELPPPDKIPPPPESLLRDVAAPPKPSPFAPPSAPPTPVEEIEAADDLAPPAPPVEEVVEVEVEVEPAPAVKPRLRDRLGKTRAVFSGLLGRTKIDDETWDELEETLLISDVGVATTTEVMQRVRARAAESKPADTDALFALLREELVAMLATESRELAQPAGKLNVWMFVGVNGVGKTTTIAKLGQREVDLGKKVVLGAADTFRAAASDQLAHWADRVGAEVVRGQDGADPGSVVFDAMAAASSRDADILMIDTAGRLHNKTNLMEELKKLRRIVDRTEGALEEVLLVIDASTGQNGVTQARIFTEAVDVTGVVLTKLDGTAKGGIVLAIQHELSIPVKLVGVGEGAADLVTFDPDEFVDALLARD